MICIGCGCDESQACTLPGGAACAWVHTGLRQLAGICTACVELFPPSTIAEELTGAEAAIAAADEERAKYGYSISVPIDQVDELFPPALSYLEPDDATLDDKIRAGFREAFDTDRRLILPGDEDFHL